MTMTVTVTVTVTAALGERGDRRQRTRAGSGHVVR